MNLKFRLNKSSVPFLLLALFQFLFVFLLKKRKSPNTWVLFFSNIGMAFIFEFIVLNIFQAYTYKPSLLKKRYFDNILGAILSQGLYIPVSSTFISVFKKRWGWKFGFTFFFYCIERLFLSLKIYDTNWWKPVYTVILLPIYYVLSDFIYKGLQQQKIILKKLAHYLTIMVIETIFMYVLAYNGLIRFRNGKSHSIRVHFMIAPLYPLIMSFMSTYLSKEKGMARRIIHLSMYKLVDILLMKSGVLLLKRDHYKWLILLWHSIVVFISRLIYKKIFRMDKSD